MTLKRAIMVLKEDEHFELKKFCVANKRTIQSVCFDAMNLYLKSKGIPIKLTQPIDKD